MNCTREVHNVKENSVSSEVSQQPLPVEAFAIHHVQDSGDLRALVSVRVGPLVLLNVQIYIRPNQNVVVQMPKSRDRSGRWWPVVKVQDPDVLHRIEEAAIALWKGGE